MKYLRKHAAFAVNMFVYTFLIAVVDELEMGFHHFKGCTIT